MAGSKVFYRMLYLTRTDVIRIIFSVSVSLNKRLKMNCFGNVWNFLHIHFLGFSVYHIAEPEKTEFPLDLDYFRYHRACADSGNFSNFRQTSARLKLHPGTYVIVPCTFAANQEGEFLLRIFAEQPAALESIQEWWKNNSSNWFSRVRMIKLKRSF